MRRIVLIIALLGSAGCGGQSEEPEVTPASDAGAPADSGLASDAALADAGLGDDASLPPLDAGAADAGRVDAGAADAGKPDAGPCAAWPESEYNYAEPDCGPRPLRVQFDGTKAIADTGLDVYKLLWSFGDGETSYATNPVHTYQQAGDYEASVALTADLGGGTDFTVNRTGIMIRVHAP